MSKQRYIYIDGQKVLVSDEFYREYQRFTRKEKYFSLDLKTEKFIYDPEKCVAVWLPSREDSYDRLLAQDKQFIAPEAESPEDTAMRKELLEKLEEALHTLSNEELDLIQTLFFLEKTEREASAALHMASSTLHDRKNAVLRKLRKEMKDFL